METYKIHMPAPNNGRDCYLYLLRHIHHGGDENCKIGVSYYPYKRALDCTSSYGWPLHLYATYLCSREDALKIELHIKKLLSEYTIENWKEFFSIPPNQVQCLVHDKIKNMGGIYAYSHHTA